MLLQSLHSKQWKRTLLVLFIDERSVYSVGLVTYEHLFRRAVKKSEQLFDIFINTLFWRLQQQAEISIS